MLSSKEAQHYQFNTPTYCHIASFNAKSIRNSSHHLINISTICDILAVQEHRLPKQSLSYLNSLHSDFSARGISIVDGIVDAQERETVALTCLSRLCLPPLLPPVSPPSVLLSLPCLRAPTSSSSYPVPGDSNIQLSSSWDHMFFLFTNIKSDLP